MRNDESKDSDGDETITTSLPLINLTSNLIMVLWILSRLSNVKVFPKLVSCLWQNYGETSCSRKQQQDQRSDELPVEINTGKSLHARKLN